MVTFPVLYSTLTTEELLRFVSNRYSISENSSILFIKRGFNDTYLITENTNKKYIVRVYKHNWKSRRNIETEVKLLNYLIENNCSVSYPIADKNKEYIQTVNAPEGLRYVVLFSFAEGQSIRKLNSEHAFLLGVETGKIHQLTQHIVWGETAFYYNFETQFNNVLTTLNPLLKDYQEEYNYLLWLQDDFLKCLQGINKNEVAQGLCHGDLQAENFHISTDGTKLAFFDFDFLGSGYLIYDIGVFIWYDHKNKTKEIITSFLKGYITERSLTDTELMLLPYFSTLRALFQINVYCKTNNGKQLPLWNDSQIATFIHKIKTWYEAQKQQPIHKIKNG